MQHDLAAELADALAAEVEIVEAHRLPSNENKLSDCHRRRALIQLKLF
jgi:hypothetical protein